MTPLSQFKVLTFDCYGTLIDWERGICDALRPWLNRNGPPIDDEALLAAFARIEKVVEGETPELPYPQVLRATYARLAESLSMPSDAASAYALADSIGDWPAFADSPDALQRLKRRYKLVILSNVDRSSFARSNQRLGVEFDAIITAEDVGSYKPAMGHFTRAAELFKKWGVNPEEWLHVAQSLFHDHAPAKSIGLATAWIDRRRGRAGTGATPAIRLATPPDWSTATLGEFADLVDASFGG